jgi:hypothetical protein
MKLLGPQMLYAFFVFFALVLVWRIRPKAVTGLHQVQDAPLGRGHAGGRFATVGGTDPRVDEQTVQEVMQTPVAAEDTEADERALSRLCSLAPRSTSRSIESWRPTRSVVTALQNKNATLWVAFACLMVDQ